MARPLYFSADGHPGLGDLDVFVSRKLPDGTWGKPTNLGPSINGPGKDNSLMVMPRGNEAMFSSDRETGWDSFWTIPLKEEAKPIEVATLKGVVQMRRPWRTSRRRCLCLMRPMAKPLAEPCRMARKDS